MGLKKNTYKSLQKNTSRLFSKYLKCSFILHNITVTNKQKKNSKNLLYYQIKRQ